MSAPEHYSYSIGSYDSTGDFAHTIQGTIGTDRLVLVQILQDGSLARQVGLTTCTNIRSLAGTAGQMTVVGSFHDGVFWQHIYAGWGTGSVDPVVNGYNDGSDDLYIRAYIFRNVPNRDSVWGIFDWGLSPAHWGFPAITENKVFPEDDVTTSFYGDIVECDNKVVTSLNNGDIVYTSIAFYPLRDSGTDTKWVTVTAPVAGSYVRDITWTGTYWVACFVSGTNPGIYTATSLGGTWTQRVAGSGFVQIHWDGTYCVALETAPYIRYATDPTGTWTQVDAGIGSYPYTLEKLGGYWLIGSQGSPYVRYATNPTASGNWGSPSGGFTSECRGFAYDGTTWAATAFGAATDAFRYTTDVTGTWSTGTGGSYASSIVYDPQRKLWFSHGQGAFWAEHPSDWADLSNPGVIGSNPGTLFVAGGEVLSRYSLSICALTPTGNMQTGGSTTMNDAETTCSGPEVLFLNLIGVNDDNALGSFTGATNGTWSEAVAEYAESTGTDACIQLQVARPSAVASQNIALTFGRPIGSSTLEEMQGQSFQTTGAITVTGVLCPVRRIGSPTDALIVEIQTDNSNKPSGTVVGSSATTIAATLPSSDPKWLRFGVSASLSASTKYWIVMRRSGSLDNSNYCSWYTGDDTVANCGADTYVSGAWTGAPAAADNGFAVLTSTQDAGCQIEGGTMTQADSDRWINVGLALRPVNPMGVPSRPLRHHLIYR